MTDLRNMTEEERTRLIRLVAVHLMRRDNPGLPIGAIGPPSSWWTTAEDLVDYIMPYMKELLVR